MKVVAYSPGLRKEWDAYVAQSKNGTFLFDRGYMDYHADRFTDSSLMVYDQRGKLFALFPANREKDTIFSHRGLTYGGLVISEKATAVKVCEAMAAINHCLRTACISKVVYKALPTIYNALPADEPLYALTELCHARLSNRDIASVVSLKNRIRLSELRRRGQKKAANNGVVIDYSNDFASFWHILEDNLLKKYGSRPVHTLDEMLLLRERFPDAIRLLAAYHGGQMIAGTVLYITPYVVKTQYISASPEGKAIGALDLLFTQLLDHPPGAQQYVDFGTSALDHSTELRQPLICQKEGFGARAVCYDTYEWTLL
ncbi:MAG: GNAT family N-acetyltransferase [Prevotella sp.]|nr:GNAT family N-acetyltransferase [Prevotella sp.]